jgi:hypothetical protein
MPHASGTPNISNKTSNLLLLYTEELANTTVPSQLTAEQHIRIVLNRVTLTLNKMLA